MDAPVTPSMMTIGSGFEVAVIGIKARTAAPATAAAAIESMVGFEPMRAITSPPQTAPATPPRLNAAMPLLATDNPSPAPASIAGTQLNAV